MLFISFFIFSEAVERLVEPPEVKHERLLVVSILGFLVNLVGIFVFQHGGAGHNHRYVTIQVLHINVYAKYIAGNNQIFLYYLATMTMDMVMDMDIAMEAKIHKS